MAAVAGSGGGGTPTEGLPEHFKVRGGQRLRFTQDGLEVETKKWFGRPAKAVILWDTISKVDVEMQCFGGTITLAVSSGQYQIRCTRSQLMIVAAALYRYTRRGGVGSKAVQLSQEAQDTLRKHRKVGICEDGLLLKKQRGCCRSSVKFVPWGALVSVSLARTRKSVVARTTLGVEALAAKAIQDQDNAAKGEPASPSQKAGQAAPPAEEGATPAPAKAKKKKKKNEELGTIRIPGAPALSEALFREMVRMMSGGHSEEQMAPDIGDKVAGAKLSQAGMMVERRCLFRGGVEKYFVPWTSLVSATWQPSSFFRKCYLSVSDTTGFQVRIKEAPLQDFDAFCATFQRAVRDTQVQRTGSSPTAGAQRGLRISEDGAHLQSGTCFGGPCKCCWPTGRRHYFVPWDKIDGLQLRAGRLPGLGTATLITENGTRLKAARSYCCGISGLWKAYDELRSFKYGSERTVLASFNRKRNPRFTSELNTQSIRVVAGSTVREWDLERVASCRTNPSYRRGRVLLLEIQSGSGKTQEVRIPIKDAVGEKGEAVSPEELAALVSAAAARRRQGQHLARAPAPAPASPCQGNGAAAAAKEAESPPPLAVPVEPWKSPTKPTAAPKVVEAPSPSARDGRPLRVATEASPQARGGQEREVSQPLTPTRGKEFRVVLERTEADGGCFNCGLVTFQRRNITTEEVALYVSGVNSGPVERWNEDNPNHQVGIGDYILEVNGCRNDFVRMLEQLQQPRVELAVRRRWP